MPGRLLIRRVLVVVVSATIAGVVLVALLAWVALAAEWQVPDPAQLSAPSVVLDRDGNVLARFTAEQDRREVALAQVSEEARLAIVASEDVRFYEHTGVDPLSLLRAVGRNVLTGSIEQGGSTLTQQYVRNGLEGIGTQRTIVRKIREAVISVQVERDHDKDWILERYLNTVYFGEGAYGIEAAALTFFGVHASELTAAQGATLAQALPAPSVRNARVDPEGARDRRNRVLTTMERQGWLSTSEAAAARAEPLVVQPRHRPDFTYPFFVEYVRKQLVDTLGQEAVLSGGLQVRTTIDPRVQTAIEQAVAERLPPQEGANADVDAGVVAIDPRTGDILGLYGGRDFATNQFDNATQAARQNGSTFKPIAFTAALEAGIDPDEPYPAPRAITIPASRCVDYDSPVETTGAAPGGALPMREGLIRSINTVLLQVACDVGPPAILDTARRLGVAAPLEPVPAVALGAPEKGASVLDLASAFATLANDGRYCPARSIAEVLDPDGEPLAVDTEFTVSPEYERRPRALSQEELDRRPDRLRALDEGRCHATVGPNIARTTTQALEQVVARSTGRRAQIGRPQAGKTGTTDEETDAWFVGYTPDLALAVWVGHTRCGDASDPACQLRNIEGFGKVQGGTIPALIWKTAAEAILAEVPPTDFPEPGELLDRDQRQVGPARRPTTPPPSPTPSPSPSPTPSPSPSPSPSPTGGTTDGGTGGGSTGGDDGGGTDGGGCLPLLPCDR